MSLSENDDADQQRKAEPPPVLTPEEFLAWRTPRDVAQQAMPLDNPLWHWMVRTRWDAYTASKMLDGSSSCDAQPMWCFDRFGMSETHLSDGRIVYIGGEHEDFCDPNFHIYNDVVMIDAARAISIRGYPRDVFAPTDFHTATLVANDIFIVGCLGHPKQRVRDVTPVYRLTLESMHMGAVQTSGDSPGWLFGHSAALDADGVTLTIRAGERWRGKDLPLTENLDEWSLNTMTGHWKRLTRKDWQHWTVRRVDRQCSRLWDVRQEYWNRERAHLGMKSSWRHNDPPDLAALDLLYCLDADATSLAQPSFNRFVAVIDGLTVRFKEENHCVEAIVEGRLASTRFQALQQQTLLLIERLEGARCEIENITR